MAEEIYHYYDRPEEPFNIQVEVRVAGALDERALRAAVHAASAVHPMTRARKASRRLLPRPGRWEIGEPGAGGVLEALDCADGSALAAARAAFYSRPIDVREAPALRLLLVHRPDGDSLLLGVNHAISDGIGALRFLHSVARAYSGRPDPIPPVDPLSVRDFQARSGHTPCPRPPVADRADVPRGRRSLIAPEGSGPDPGYGFRHMALSAEQGRRLNPARLGPLATVNDLLLAVLHRTVETWNRDRGRPCHEIAVLMPVNLRPPEWRHEVIGDLILCGQVVSTPGQRASADSLLDAVISQTRRIKAGGEFEAILGMRPWVRTLLTVTLALWGGRPSDTAAVLSNLGRIEEPPDFGEEAGGLTEFWVSPPAMMPMGLSVGAASLQGRLHLVIRHRRALFDEGAARRFSDLFLECLRDLAEAEREDGPARPDTRRQPAEETPVGRNRGDDYSWGQS